jgi:hypothetical protein
VITSTRGEGLLLNDRDLNVKLPRPECPVVGFGLKALL